MTTIGTAVSRDHDRATPEAEVGSGLTARIDRLESESAIRRLIANYCHGIDKRDLEIFSSVWHPDAEYVGGPFGDCRGLPEIQRSMIELVWPGQSETVHWTTNVAIDIDGDDASGGCDAHVMVISRSDKANLVAANYRDVYRRRSGTWRISRRVIDVLYICRLAGAEWKHRRTSG